MKTRVGIVGAAGYTASELLRILANHGTATVSYVASESLCGSSVGKAHPHLRNLIDLEIKPYDRKEMAINCDVVFLAKPEPSSFRFAKELFEEGLRLIDLSPVFRLRDASEFEKWYGLKHEYPELLRESVYGLPELNGDKIKKAKLVANPGCYPTGVILGLAPLIKAGVVEKDSIIVNSVSGFSGAGRGKQNENNLAANVVDNVKPYKLTNHPHTPEIEQELGKLWAAKPQKGGTEEACEVKVTFVPHVAGFERGIINTMYLRAKSSRGMPNESASAINRLYEDFYKDKPFVRICQGDETPQIKNVLCTNFCDVGVYVNERTGIVIVVSVLDNLVKGASGQAVQNMNLMLGYDECAGLGHRNDKKKVDLKKFG